ncbi:C2H2-type zinc finger transcription factor [Phycomyces blakesleeanus NRRL 1555(-)]|uniref:C2H2-type zinc finger transcription factor n=1 Tax=Phycomyces blakesleeanus (strain ATCC 8743b / DSM 1359 / FGSC 10004 / NBRC 33097 / NRRL 1555) TaxID=763407 RepID=A0A162NJV6_PHYB8|nr:C2H2-type zinc finger transcription factor [Phycomyces blakesleeanus NRRL 1555(-)]OAD74888.1 C2H2-type zinc finger transcription factor [Phycomyces blakesleeanus NRRL 1555(-)]|eukprot:XP_018292928.1 C2H2-type zinc finger transcription factor [Phycomyces blakesleeanus NRRL 1555(-)]
MSYSNKRIRSSTDLPSFECNFCSLTYPTSKQLCNHKRIHKTFNAPVAKENLQEPVLRTFEASYNFEAGDQGHIYNDNIFTNNIFITSELFSIYLNNLVTDFGVSTARHSLLVDLMNTAICDNDKLKEEYNPKFLYAGPVNMLVKSKTDLKSYEYDICINLRSLFDITKDEEECSICKARRYKEIDSDSSLVPVNTMKMMSLGDQLVRLLEYKTLKEQQLFDSPDDIAIALFLHDFVNQKKSKQQLTIMHVIVLNYNPEIRYTDKYLTQLAIIPGKPKDLDSFLLSIIDEISSLGKHGLSIKKFNREQIKVKVHMVMASNDIPQVTQFCHHTGHISNKGCRICEIESISSSHGKGKYCQGLCATLRTKDNFVRDKKATGIKEATIFAQLPTFSGSCFYRLNEMYLLGHGIDKLIYKLAVLSNTESLEAYWPKSEDGSHFMKERYTFSLKESDVKLAGRQIQYSRSNIPVSFQGSWDNIIDKREGALLALVKGCSICLQWNLNENMIVEIEKDFNIWHQFLDSEITKKNLSVRVFSSVNNYIINIGLITRKMDNLRVYSTRSMEQTIGRYSKLIKNFDELVNPILSTRTSLDDFLELSSLSPYNYDYKLWSPFKTIPYIQEFINISTITKDLLTFYA